MQKFDWRWCYMHRDAVCLIAYFFDFIDRIQNTGFFNLPASLFLYMIKFVCQIRMYLILICYKTTMMMLKCKHNVSHITFGIAPNWQIQT